MLHNYHSQELSPTISVTKTKQSSFLEHHRNDILQTCFTNLCVTYSSIILAKPINEVTWKRRKKGRNKEEQKERKKRKKKGKRKEEVKESKRVKERKERGRKKKKKENEDWFLQTGLPSAPVTPGAPRRPIGPGGPCIFRLLSII